MTGAGALVAVVLVVAAAGTPRSADAHAVLVRSDPAAMPPLAPSSIGPWFSEPSEEGLPRLGLIGAGGRRLPLGRVRIEPGGATRLSALPRPLPAGYDTVAYRTISSPDRPGWSGSFTCTALAPAGSPLLGSPAPQLPANTLAVVLLGGAGGAALLLASGSRRRFAPHARAAAVAGLTLAGMLWLSVDRHPATPALVNPAAGDPASAERGRPLYQQHCVACHGVEGRGDGPGAAGLSSAPADLMLHVPHHPDADIFAFIAQGFDGTAMQGWSGVLTEEQIWDLVNYLREELAARG